MHAVVERHQLGRAKSLIYDALSLATYSQTCHLFAWDCSWPTVIYDAVGWYMRAAVQYRNRPVATMNNNEFPSEHPEGCYFANGMSKLTKNSD